jgi:small-conductance mechanosensitive channel
MASATPPAANTAPLAAIQHQLNDTVAQTSAWLRANSLGVGIAIVAGVLIALLLVAVRRLGSRLCAKDATGTGWLTIAGRLIDRMTMFFIVAASAELVAGYAAPPGALATTIRSLFVVAATLQGAIWVRELILGIVEHRAGDAGTDHGTLISAMNIIRVLVNVAVFAVALILILDNLGVNVTGLVAGLGIGGIAIGLAAQGIFADLFAALAILFDKPFRRGDSIQYDKTSGTVENIGLKTTRLRAITGEQVIISNTKLLSNEIRNTARLDRRRTTFTIGLTYDTSPDVLETLPADIKRIVESVDKCKYVHAGLRMFADSALNIDVQIDVKTSSADVLWDRQHKVMVAVLRDFNARGLDFAFPTQTSINVDADAAPMEVPGNETARPAGNGRAGQ